MNSRNLRPHTLIARLAAALALTSVGLASAPVQAAPAWSWNLSRDMMIDFAAPANNSLGPWTFMETATTCHDATALPTFGGPGACWGASWQTNLNCWSDLSVGAMNSAAIGLPHTPIGWQYLHEGVPFVHPGYSTQAVVRWTNPLNQAINVQVLGRFTHIDPYGAGLADGVNWYVKDANCEVLISGCTGASASGVLQSTSMSSPNDSGVFSFSAKVDAGDTLDFTVDRNANYFYDLTELDVLIVGQ